MTASFATTGRFIAGNLRRVARVKCHVRRKRHSPQRHQLHRQREARFLHQVRSISSIALHQNARQSHRSDVTQLDGSYIDARTRVLDPKPALAGHLGTAGAAFPTVWNSPFD